MLFTVFTPTFNRAHLLPRLFQSLTQQTVRNFEWLIIDDGSTDDTNELVSQFIDAADFPVRYIRQENQGKHIAINTAAENALGKWYLPVDSDDFVAPTCLKICQTLAEETAGSESAGFTFIHAPESFQGNQPEYGKKRWFEYNSYEWNFAGEMIYVFKVDVLRKYPFPVFKEEKFCQESVQLIPIIRNYQVLYTDHILAFGEYLEDGLSQNLYQRLLNNPQYSMLAVRTKLRIAKSRTEIDALALTYWDLALKTGQPLMKTFFGFPIDLSISYFAKRVMRKMRS